MELNLISENKLKVVLSREELDEYQLSFESINYENTETRRVFWSILDEAKRKTGFDGAANKIFIQVYSDKKGGCEILVSKIGDRDRGRSKSPLITYVGRTLPDSSRTVSQAIFRFDCLNTLISACKCLDRRGFSGISTAFAGDKHCYLVLLATEQSHLVLLEFSEKIENENYIYYIKEHCKEFCVGDAVQTLAMY